MTYLTDEQAIAKANSIEWFDNQAGMADFFTPKKKLTLSRPKQKELDLDDMTIEQLKEKYTIAREQLNVINDVPKELRELINDRSRKVYSYMLAIKTAITKKQIEIRGVSSVEEQKDYEVEIKGLKGKIAALNNQLAQAKLSNNEGKAAKKLEKIEKATAREIMIHIKFKGLVKEYIGEDKYITLIREADVLADAELNK